MSNFLIWSKHNFFFFFNFILFLAALGPCCGARASHCGGLSRRRAQAPGAQASGAVPRGLRSTGSAAVAHEPSRSEACGILPDQGSNPRPPHRQADPQPLCHQGSPSITFITHLFPCDRVEEKSESLLGTKEKLCWLWTSQVCHSQATPGTILALPFPILHPFYLFRLHSKELTTLNVFTKDSAHWGFPGGAVVANLPASAGDTGSSPGLGRSHMPRSY